MYNAHSLMNDESSSITLLHGKRGWCDVISTPYGQGKGKAAVLARKLRSIYGDQCFEIANSPCWPQTLVVVIPKRGEWAF